MRWSTAVALVLVVSPVAAQSRGVAGSPVAGSAVTDSAAVAAIVERFHGAYAAGDSSAILAMLAPDVVLLESGGTETLDEYRSHHLPGDLGYAKSVKITRAPIRVVVRGDAAWAWSTSRAAGEFRGRRLNVSAAELIVLVRDAGRWRVAAIHWSSRNARTGG